MDRTDRTDRIEITGIRHAWPEGAGFELERPQGHEDYTLLHFFDSVDVLSGVSKKGYHVHKYENLLKNLSGGGWFIGGSG